MAYSCYYHTKLTGCTVCSRCGRKICASCSKSYGELTLCPVCYHTSAMMSITRQDPSTSNAAANKQDSTETKPPIPHRRTIIILLSVSAALIWINADLLLWWPAFYEVWTGIFPWIIQLGSLTFILGVVLGLVIDMAVIAYSFGLRVESAFVVFPTAIVSFIIGGGFLVGLIIAVLTGIFIMINEKTLEALTSQLVST